MICQTGIATLKIKAATSVDLANEASQMHIVQDLQDASLEYPKECKTG